MYDIRQVRDLNAIGLIATDGTESHTELTVMVDTDLYDAIGNGLDIEGLTFEPLQKVTFEQDDFQGHVVYEADVNYGYIVNPTLKSEAINRAMSDTFTRSDEVDLYKVYTSLDEVGELVSKIAV